MKPPLDIFVTIGTDHHRFTRLIDWLDEWLQAHPETNALVQNGQSAGSRLARNQEFFDFDDLQATMAAARIVIVHGGPGSIFEARAQGRLPVCVPRDPAFDEVVDDHQQRFCRLLAEEDLIVLCETKQELFVALDQFNAAPEGAHLTEDEDRVARTVTRLRAVIEQVTTQRPSKRRQPGWRLVARKLRRG